MLQSVPLSRLASFAYSSRPPGIVAIDSPYRSRSFNHPVSCEDCLLHHDERWLILRLVGICSNDLKDTCPEAMLYWRPISEADLTECLDIQSECMGDQI